MKKRSIFNFLIFIMIIMYILIIFSGSNIFNKFQKLYFLIICLISFFLIVKKRFIFDKISFLLLFQLMFLIFTVFYSIDFQSSLIFIIIYSICTLVSIFYYDSKIIEKLLKAIEGVSLISAIVIILSIMKNDLITTNLSFLFPNNAALRVTLNEVKYNIFSGLALERGYAAFGLNLGIISIISRMCINEKNKKSDYLKIILMVIALFSCGKRTLLVIPIVIFIIILFFNDFKKFAINIIKYLVLCVTLIVILSTYIPTVNTLLERFTDISNDTSYNGRTNYWEYCFDMYDESKILGKGINTYPTYLSLNSGLDVYHAHNIYIQLLGETGILGFSICTFSFLMILISTIKFLQKKRNHLNIKQRYMINCSISMQLLFLTYGMTGNTFYYFEQLIIYFLAINILKSVQSEVKKDEKNRNFNISQSN